MQVQAICLLLVNGVLKFVPNEQKPSIVTYIRLQNFFVFAAILVRKNYGTLTSSPHTIVVSLHCKWSTNSRRVVIFSYAAFICFPSLRTCLCKMWNMSIRHYVSGAGLGQCGLNLVRNHGVSTFSNVSSEVYWYHYRPIVVQSYSLAISRRALL